MTEGSAKITAKSISSIILLVITILLLILLVYSYTHTPVVAVITGNSMLPLLREGDIVFLTQVDPGDIRPGDIIVFKSRRGSYIIHRVMDVVYFNGSYYYVTKGDNNLLADIGEFENGRGVPYTRVVGRVVSIQNHVIKIPYLGRITLMFKGKLV